MTTSPTKAGATQGPWTFAPASDRDMRFEVAQVENLRIYAEMYPPYPRTGKPVDDARLISSAPLMLEALREAREVLAVAIGAAWEGATKLDIAEHYTIKKIDAAIAAAQGDA